MSLVSSAVSVRSLNEAGASMRTNWQVALSRSMASWTAGRVTSSARSGRSAPTTRRTLPDSVTKPSNNASSTTVPGAGLRSASVWFGWRLRYTAESPNSTSRSSRPTGLAERAARSTAVLTARHVVPTPPFAWAKRITLPRFALPDAPADLVALPFQKAADHLLDHAIVVDKNYVLRLIGLGPLGGEGARQVALRIALEPREGVGAIAAHHRQPGRGEGASCFAWVARQLEGGPELKVGDRQVGVEVGRLAKRADRRLEGAARRRMSTFRHQPGQAWTPSCVIL